MPKAKPPHPGKATGIAEWQRREADKWIRAVVRSGSEHVALTDHGVLRGNQRKISLSDAIGVMERGGAIDHDGPYQLAGKAAFKVGYKATQSGEKLIVRVGVLEDDTKVYIVTAYAEGN